MTSQLSPSRSGSPSRHALPASPSTVKGNSRPPPKTPSTILKPAFSTPASAPPTSLTEPNCLQTTWTYDNCGRRLTETRPDGTRSTTTYARCANCWQRSVIGFPKPKPEEPFGGFGLAIGNSSLGDTSALPGTPGSFGLEPNTYLPGSSSFFSNGSGFFSPGAGGTASGGMTQSTATTSSSSSTTTSTTVTYSNTVGSSGCTATSCSGITVSGIGTGQTGGAAGGNAGASSGGVFGGGIAASSSNTGGQGLGGGTMVDFVPLNMGYDFSDGAVKLAANTSGGCGSGMLSGPACAEGGGRASVGGGGGGAAAKAISGETKFTSAGRRAHAQEPLPPGFEREVTIPGTKLRMDGYNGETKQILEIKPNNNRAVQRGEKQLEKYCAACDKSDLGPGHSTVPVQIYDPSKYIP